MTRTKEITLSRELSDRLAATYEKMQADYDRVARQVGLTCDGCPDNCCDSYFLHYTYAEWAYLWEGLRALEAPARQRIAERSARYVEKSREILARNERPQLMCPLNEEGLCTLYTHRLMICRLHGVPAQMVRPDGRSLSFPGCFRCQEITGRDENARPAENPSMDRTRLLTEIAALESELLGGRRHLYPRVRRTIAEMIASGPPRVDKPFCER